MSNRDEWSFRNIKPRIQEIGKKNIIGAKIVEIREEQDMKQKELLTRLQVLGMDISATSLSRLEGQHRLAQDYEVAIVAQALKVDIRELLPSNIKLEK